MRSIRTLSAALSLVMVFATGSVTRADTAAAGLAKAPEAVQAAVKKAMGEKKLTEFDEESVGGKIRYEAGYKVEDVEHAYVFNETGELVQEEEDIEVSKLPEPVGEAVKKVHPDGKVEEAALATAGESKFYDVDVKVGAETFEVRVHADGSVIADEVVKPVGK